MLRSLDDPALRHNLPSQATSFVGRTVELAELRALVSGGSRLVTIAGPGGIGKSRLALQVAADALDGTGDGVWLVELAPVAEPELVTRTTAAALAGQRGAGAARARHLDRRPRRPGPADRSSTTLSRCSARSPSSQTPSSGRALGSACWSRAGSRLASAGSTSSGFPAWPSRPPISPLLTGWPPSSRCSCSLNTPRCTGGASPSTTPARRRWRRSASVSTVSRWPSSSPRPVLARCRRRRSTSGSISGSGC